MQLPRLQLRSMPRPLRSSREISSETPRRTRPRLTLRSPRDPIGRLTSRDRCSVARCGFGIPSAKRRLSASIASWLRTQQSRERRSNIAHGKFCIFPGSWSVSPRVPRKRALRKFYGFIFIVYRSTAQLPRPFEQPFLVCRVDSYKRGTLDGANESPSFSKGHPL
jgi:hypothetical protein